MQETLYVPPITALNTNTSNFDSPDKKITSPNTPFDSIDNATSTLRSPADDVLKSFTR